MATSCWRPPSMHGWTACTSTATRCSTNSNTASRPRRTWKRWRSGSISACPPGAAMRAWPPCLLLNKSNCTPANRTSPTGILVCVLWVCAGGWLNIVISLQKKPHTKGFPMRIATTSSRTPSLKSVAIGAAVALLSGIAINSIAAAAPGAYDKQFLSKAADAGSTEIAASKLAQSKSSNGDVKQFADAMVTQHTQVADELKQLAGSKQIAVSDAPGARHKAQLDKLGRLEGRQFDTEYAASIGVAAHKDAVKLFTDASQKASDPDIKAFAVKTLPALQHHLDMANALHAALAK
ncbi:MAG: DUF4142 domain-containing protein [Janthinobacterium sp.]|nr:DUF4142 domain-containing protein [Janthinobacterium sp.]